MLLAGLAASALAAPPALADDDGDADPLRPILTRGERYVPQPAGTKSDYTFWFGPYTVAPGHDGNRVDLELPVHDGFLVALEPGMRLVADGSEPSHQEAHIHHAHWLAFDPGNPEDSYTRGLTEWVFGAGDEETRADLQPRSDAELAARGPGAPAYGQFVGRSAPQVVVYMLHNKTAQPLVVYIALDVTFVHGTAEEIERATGRPYHDVTGALFGRTYNVPRGRDGDGDGYYEYAEDSGRTIEWTSTVDGVIVGTGGHLHPGGVEVTIENHGRALPGGGTTCGTDGRAYGGRMLYRGDALFRNDVLYSEDFQMEVTPPAWRAPIRKGDRIRLSGRYESREHAWYAVMTHAGFYIDEAQDPDSVDPDGDCAPTLIDGSSADPTEGIPNRPWGHHEDAICGEQYGAPPCEPYAPSDPGPGIETSTVLIADFAYLPGQLGGRGALGAPPRVRRGTPLRFVNVDQAAGIRHTVTTCRWPCNGPYVANYPFADGAWDSGTMGYDPIDGGNPSPLAETPPTLPAGKYAYFCRIHPWMRGAFEVVE
jgi:plastocyanin